MDLFRLLSIALQGERVEFERLAKRLIRDGAGEEAGALARIALDALRGADRVFSPFRSETQAAVPVDIESRARLLRTEYPVTLENEPIWSSRQVEVMGQIISERRRLADLHTAGLSASRTCLFVGPPGCGKTQAARWLARELGVPLFILDLASVISSFLGRTGNNIRNVLDYTKGLPCVLLLDEIDAIAKRRDDDVEIGELKRLVTVLLQEVDAWPERSLLVGATNHPGLLDRAVWRRFELLVEFPLPTPAQARKATAQALNGDSVNFSFEVLNAAISTRSFSDIYRDVLYARRNAVITSRPLDVALRDVLRMRLRDLPRSNRHAVALSLLEARRGQREISDLTGVSRDTIRKLSRERSMDG